MPIVVLKKQGREGKGTILAFSGMDGLTNFQLEDTKSKDCQQVPKVSFTNKLLSLLRILNCCVGNNFVQSQNHIRAAEEKPEEHASVNCPINILAVDRWLLRSSVTLFFLRTDGRTKYSKRARRIVL
jgi:hypothetical protein